MTDAARIRILRQIEQGDATDAFATKGKAPVMNERAWAGLRAIEPEGLIALDESECPIVEVEGGRHVMGLGFVSLTDAGRAALAQSK